jgi:CcmD family protein
MDGWGYVLLAYGIVWTALVIYWLNLRKRMSRAQAKLSEIKTPERSEAHG